MKARTERPKRSTVEVEPTAYGANDVAKILGVTSMALCNWRQWGEGPPYFKVGLVTIAYPKDRLEAWIAAKRKAAA
jgi:Helix-turn-helix domain